MSGSGDSIERVWLAVAPDGQSITATIGISAPQRQPDGAWTCMVTLGKLAGVPDTVHGIDSWQAVEEAMQHAAVCIAHLQSQGWRFYFNAEDLASGEAASPADLHRGVSTRVGTAPLSGAL